MAKEECAELIVALCHHERKRCEPKDVLEEIVDVLAMCNQLMYIYGFTMDDFRAVADRKVARVEKRVIDRENDLADQSKFRSKMGG